MKILLIHNYYDNSSPSGENILFEEEKKVLIRNGHFIKTISCSNNWLSRVGIFGKVFAGLSYIFNFYFFIKKIFIVKKFKPNLIHVHNFFPQISSSVFFGNSNIPHILTLHNYRLICPSAQLRRGNIICHKCLNEKFFFSSLRYKCYKNSIFQTFPIFFSSLVNKYLGTWTRNNIYFIALTEFQKNLFIQSGFSKNNIFVRPNYFPDNPKVISFLKRKGSIIFVGRLSEEKGLKSLIDAWQLWGISAPKLQIVGDGPLLKSLKKLNLTMKSNIEICGQLSKNETQDYIKNSKLLIIPSIWYEGFPLVVREAFAFGVPILFSNIGALKEIAITSNLPTFETNNHYDLFKQVKKIWSNQKNLESLSTQVHDVFKSKYSLDINYNKLLEIYNIIQSKNKNSE